ncbi:uncharacterized protein LOC129003010 isoform X2 [Macrosteles quadrilineatus]|uniref:uncharacterized protein LOC129003010 isoform X2 n=1 Tax=Macrosteles quadrilineatus TaxID=74068 RepID=UPI0023E1726D|nr:uncharacterized protein LOC129003010 isoform X2 [Macrosteles quadrilineatus]
MEGCLAVVTLLSWMGVVTASNYGPGNTDRTAPNYGPGKTDWTNSGQQEDTVDHLTLMLKTEGAKLSMNKGDDVWKMLPKSTEMHSNDNWQNKGTFSGPSSTSVTSNHYQLPRATTFTRSPTKLANSYNSDDPAIMNQAILARFKKEHEESKNYGPKVGETVDFFGIAQQPNSDSLTKGQTGSAGAFGLGGLIGTKNEEQTPSPSEQSQTASAFSLGSLFGSNQGEQTPTNYPSEQTGSTGSFSLGSLGGSNQGEQTPTTFPPEIVGPAKKLAQSILDAVAKVNVQDLGQGNELTSRLMELCTESMENDMVTVKQLKKADTSLIKVRGPLKLHLKGTVGDYLMKHNVLDNFDDLFMEYWENIREKLVLLRVQHEN